MGAGDVTTTGSGSTITITASAATFPWTAVTVVGPTSMSVNNGYVANNGASPVQLTLPLLSSVGDVIEIAGIGAGLWQVNQNGGQSINLSSTSTTVGGGGTLEALDQFCSVKMVCTAANTDWTIVSATGNFNLN